MSKREASKDTDIFMKGLLTALTEDPKNNDSLKTLRSCMDRITALNPENRKRLFRGIVENGLTNLQVKLPQEECAMNGHQFTEWEEAEYIETECCEDLTSREGEEVCKPWELPDGMRTYLMQQTPKTRWERFCKHCLRYEYSEVDPAKLEEAEKEGDTSLTRRVRSLQTPEEE